MSKTVEAIAQKLSPQAAREFRDAVREMHLLNNAGGVYQSRNKAKAQLNALRRERDDLAARVEDSASARSELEALREQLDQAARDHKRELGELQSRFDHERKAAAVKQRLSVAGALDPELAYLALRPDLDSLACDASGNLEDISNSINTLQKEKTFLFALRQPQGTHLHTTGRRADPHDQVNDALARLGYKTGEHHA